MTGSTSAPVTIGVIGCGAIGGIFAAHLARVPGVTVWVYDVSRSLVEAITTGGIRILGDSVVAGTPASSIRATADPSALPACDFGIVATKSEHTASAIAATAHAFVGGAVASVQNGIGNEEVMAEHVRAVIRGSTLVSGSVEGAGVVRFDAPGGTWLGPFEGSPATADAVRRLAELITAAGLPAAALADARGAQWTKLIFNSANNALCAATGLSIGQLADSPRMRELVGGIICEGAAVATAAGITLEGDPQAMFDDAVAHAHGHRPSMLQDVAARRHTEIAVLNGGVAAEGRRLGIPTPLNDTLVAVVEGIEQSWL